MPVGTKLLTGLPIVTGISAYPLAVVVKNQGLKVELKEEVPPPATAPITSPISSGPALVQETIKKLFEAGYSDCTLINGYRGPGVLYVCSFQKTDGAYTPTFFYYNKKDISRPIKDRFRKVTYISTKQGNSGVRLEDGETIKFTGRMYPFWMSKMSGELYPETNCTIDKQAESSKLTCKGHVMNQNQEK
ncbi:hypothetical protein DNK47_01475 [Mycoplasma wenyonii]|uniref:Uncharacterized protein n=1 Tax=Mycoplasma wenyonii TaxID=65123 RepID=A0A328PJY1_9MOLU|nr:hypothetical protein [Mycoplasma wenyonii]RAO95142.1 hypothetical protein DNK47_01475 [Mycoplasma wenyonii]